MLLNPRMILCHMVWHKVEHQFHTALLEPLAETGQCGLASQRGRDGIPGNRKSRAADVLLAQVRQGILEFPAPFGIGERSSLPCRTGLPDAKEPDPVKAHLPKTVQ